VYYTTVFVLIVAFLPLRIVFIFQALRSMSSSRRIKISLLATSYASSRFSFLRV